MASSIEILGDRASKPCDIGDAHGVGLVCNSPGLETNLVPFRHPELLNDEVRVKVLHSGLCQSDALMLKNGWGFTQYPFVGGHEIIGEVTHVGEKVTKLQVGDRVGHGPMRECCETCRECLTGYNNLCSSGVLTVGLHFGGWATSFQSKANSFVKLNECVPGAAAPLMCAGITVYTPLAKDTVPGMKVGVVGIGGLGHLGLMYANKMGCEVTAISTSPNKEAEAREFGAHHFINSNDKDQVSKNERTLDYILTTGLSCDYSYCYDLLKPRGVLDIVGAPESPQSQPFHPSKLIYKMLTIKASAAGSRIDMEDMIDFSVRHKIYPKSEMYELTQAKEAINSLANSVPRAPKYRAVFDTSSYFKTFTPKNN